MTCAAGVVDFGEFGKGPGESIPLELDFLANLAEFWTPAAFVAEGKVVRATKSTGWAYQALGSGETAFKEPRWAVGLGTDTPDGSLTWRTISPIGAGFDGITAVEVAPVDGLAISEVSWMATAVRLRVAGGSKGSSYQISVLVTTQSGDELEGRLQVCVV